LKGFKILENGRNMERSAQRQCTAMVPKVCAMCMSWAQVGTSLPSIANEGEFDRHHAAAGQNTGLSWKI